ncbi:Uncharacterised protein [Serratia proteamaculans]|nr:Uncharacterised protein [Serratia proteamaculans]CAI0850076.1 Uncharacterised protein [Serratia proteamaculans]CAI2046165.1 Uncharacterised protein [Serratia proteamaculans]CAI2399775.1 Uncharacterised protein [Serratia proteamaculans]
MRKVKSYKSTIISFRTCVDDRHLMIDTNQRAEISRANNNSPYIHSSLGMILT